MSLYRHSTSTSPLSISSVQPDKSPDIELECRRILDWIKGPGEKLLASQTSIPTNFEEADELRKNHEQFEFKCTESIGSYAHLTELPRRVKASAAFTLLDSQLQQFLQKLHHRRNIVVSCFTYFRLLNELQVRVNRLEQLLGTDAAKSNQFTINGEKAEDNLRQLEDLLNDLNTRKEAVRHERQRLRLLLGDHLPPALEKAVRDSWAKLTTLEQSASLQQLQWRKESRLGRCKGEAENSISWLAGLELVLQGSYRDYGVGKTPVETAELLMEMNELHHKAEEAYEFSAGLLQTLEKMFHNEPRLMFFVNELENELQTVWRQYGLLWQELKERRQMADTVYKEVDMLLSRVESLLLTLANAMSNDDKAIRSSQSSHSSSRHCEASSRGTIFDKQWALDEWIQDHILEREEIIRQYERTAQIATSLAQRLTVSLDQRSDKKLEDNSSLESTRGILHMKLYTLWIKIVELDDYLGARPIPKESVDRNNSLPRPNVSLRRDMRVGAEKLLEKMVVYETNWKEMRLPCNLSQCALAIHRHEHAREDIEKQWDKLRSALLPLSASISGAREALDKCSALYTPWSMAWKKESLRLQERHVILSRIEEWLTELQAPRRSALNHMVTSVKWNEGGDVAIWNGQIDKRIREIPELSKHLEELFHEIHQSDTRLAEEDFLQEHSTVADIQHQWSSYLRMLRLVSYLLEESVKLHRDILPQICPFKSEWIQRYQQCLQRQRSDECWRKLSMDSRRMNNLWSSVDMGALKQAARDLYQSERPIQGLLECLNEYPFDGCPQMREILNYTPPVRVVRRSSKQSLESVESDSSCSVSSPLKVHCLTSDRITEELEVNEEDGFIDSRATSPEPLSDRSLLSNAECSFTKPSISPPVRRADHSGTGLDVIVDPLKDQEVHLGGIAEFRCTTDVMKLKELSSKDGGTLTWYFENSPLTPQRCAMLGIQIKHSLESGECHLVIPYVQGRHAGSYTCVVMKKGSSEVTSSSAHLAVVDAITAHITEPPLSPEVVKSGGKIHLRVAFQGVPTPSVIWLKDDKPLIHAVDRMEIVTNGQESHLIINAVNESDVGSYAVEVRNSLGCEKSSITDIGKDDILTSNLSSQECLEGKAVCFQIGLDLAESNHIPRRCYWYKDNQLITPTTHPHCRITFSKEFVRLNIPSASNDDAGIYRVVVETSEGQVESEAALSIKPQNENSTSKLEFNTSSNTQSIPHTFHAIESQTKIHYPPEFIRAFTDQICPPGQRVMFIADVVGSPQPMLWWSYNGNILSETNCEGNYEFRRELVPSVNENNTTNRCTLILPAASSTTCGRYSLNAENSLGLATCSALLVVLDEPHSYNCSRNDNDEFDDDSFVTENKQSSLNKRRMGNTLETLSFSNQDDDMQLLSPVLTENEFYPSPLTSSQGSKQRSARPDCLSESEDKAVNFDSPLSNVDPHVCCPCEHNRGELVLFAEHEEFRSRRFSFAESSEFDSEAQENST